MELWHQNIVMELWHQNISFRFNVNHITCNRMNIKYLIKQIVQSTINNNLLFIMPFLHVSAFTRPLSWRLYTKEYKCSKFCGIRGRVELKYNIVS
jgi:hypothetical protein